MGRYVSRQLASIIPTILLSIVINFLLLHAAPGDPARVMAGRDNPTEAQIAAIRADLGLDQPLPVQFWRYVQQLAQGNLGESIAFKQPVFSLIIVVVATLGSGIVYVMIVIGLTAWPTSARLMRAQALTLRDRTFIQALRALGESSPRILVRHIIPNGIQPLIANASLDIASAILIEAGLSFIGLGDPNQATWGRMIFDGRTTITTTWWASVFPGLAIIVTVLGFYLVGDGISYVLNPRSRRVKS